MSKDKISDYSATANSNTDIGGINIDEGCAPSGINDAIRTLMKQLKDWQSGSQDVYIHPAGSASVPSITATGDTNTGIFFPAADTVGITTGGTERARVDSSGNLGLGVTPSAWGGNTKYFLEFVKGVSIGGNTAVSACYVSTNAYSTDGGATWTRKTADYAEQYLQYNGQHIWATGASSTAGSAITFTQAMTLDSAGFLGIGPTSPTAPLDVLQRTSDDDNALQLRGYTTGSDGTRTVNVRAVSSNAGDWANLQFKAQSIRFIYQGGTERARIDSSGNLLVGKTNTAVSVNNGCMMFPTGFLGVNASSSVADNYNYYNSTAGAYRFYVTSGGTIYATSTTISAISDERLKENIKDIDTGLDAVMALKPRRFDWKEGKGQDKKNAAGFIAQEFETVFPASVGLSKAGEDGVEYKNINHEELIPTLVKAIQEMKSIIDQQAARITALEQA